MPYQHLVARIISVLWWGIYLGVLGASIGSLLGLFTDRTHARLSRVSSGAGEPPLEAGIDCRAHPTELSDEAGAIS
jgi:hypothetical protein